MNQEYMVYADLGYLRCRSWYRRRGVWVEAELVHDPLRLPPLGRSAPVEHQRLAHPHHRRLILATAGDDGAVLAGGLPVAGARGAVGALPRRVLAVAQVEEVPLLPTHERRF